LRQQTGKRGAQPRPAEQWPQWRVEERRAPFSADLGLRSKPIPQRAASQYVSCFEEQWRVLLTRRRVKRKKGRSKLNDFIV
jgi:hypothetical protein